MCVELPVSVALLVVVHQVMLVMFTTDYYQWNCRNPWKQAYMVMLQLSSLHRLW